jgi:hypothetical protein
MTWQVKFAPRRRAVIEPFGHRFGWRRGPASEDDVINMQ